MDYDNNSTLYHLNCGICGRTFWSHDAFANVCSNCIADKEQIDIVEVVRCKDCIYGEHEKNESTGTEWIYCAHHRENRPNEWFCASGSPTIKQKGRKME